MSPQISKRWIVALLLVNLLLGIVIGILVDQHLLTPAEAKQSPGQIAPQVFPQPAPPSRDGFLNKIDEELELSEQQKAIVGELFDKHRQVERQAFREHFQKFQEMRNGFGKEIEEHLSSEQQEKFREMMERLRHQMEQRRRQGPGSRMMPMRPGGPRPEHVPPSPERTF